MEIYVADHTEAVYIPEWTLVSASSYFVAAIRNIGIMGHLEGEELDVLRFPRDDVEAWRVLMYWIVKQTLPHEVPKITIDVPGQVTLMKA